MRGAAALLALAAGLAFAAGPARAQEDALPLGAPQSEAPAAARSQLLPVPTMPQGSGMEFPASSDAAFGAYQRGYYLSALRIAEPLANLGDAAAQTLMGELYLRGLGVTRNEAEAARWYRVAAEAGVAEAQFRLAMMLVDGIGVPADPAAARDLMKQAADADNPLAAFNYGQMLIQSSPTGGFAEAAGYFRTAAEAGVSDAQYALSQLYAYGQGVPEQSDVSARRWLHAAAVRGHETAQIDLGIWLINGRGGPSDPLGGFRWLKGAAERGNPIAVNRVAHLYKDGVGTTRDTAEAAKWTVLARRMRNADPALDSFFRSLPQEEQRSALEAANRLRIG
ncbi:tetratricopeptide repeat protein [Aureimonas populi]|uniref:Tetratricopeptide repeat protein n=1 Tax=Aureimonas populi TaxID=1701758 RepID=A0ABW5CJ01_9HYPH|nr:tetratricopeptide repeat protein [Aureimonas populi]